MNAQLNDVVVHLNETLDEGTLKDLEQAIRQQEGVISVGHTPGKSHLLAVVFNSAVTGAPDILRRVQERGVHAQLVGM